jgi:hypothetical protein
MPLIMCCLAPLTTLALAFWAKGRGSLKDQTSDRCHTGKRKCENVVDRVLRAIVGYDRAKVMALRAEVGVWDQEFA